MIVGNTKDEMSLLLLEARMPADEAAYRKTLQDDFGDQAEALAEAYPVQDAKQIRATIIQLTSDLSFVIESRCIARKHSATGQKTFRYQFSLGNKFGFLGGLGAHHGAELPYLSQWRKERGDPGFRISRTLGRYWINFAATGDPNGPGLPDWPAYRADTQAMVDFAEQVHVLRRPRNDQLDVIENVLQALSDIPAKKTEK
jgi:para-nitrobenzyl esterase